MWGDVGRCREICLHHHAVGAAQVGEWREELHDVQLHHDKVAHRRLALRGASAGDQEAAHLVTG